MSEVSKALHKDERRSGVVASSAAPKLVKVSLPSNSSPVESALKAVLSSGTRMTRLLRFALLMLGAALLVSCATETGRRTSAEQQVARVPESRVLPVQPCLDLNKATSEELMRLPGVGEVMARRIVDYRKQHGPLRRPQEIIIVEGFSERKYHAIADLVCVE